jgi:hypothetical protein
MRRAQGDAVGEPVALGSWLGVDLGHGIKVYVSRSASERIETGPPQTGTAEQGADQWNFELAEQGEERFIGPGQAGFDRGADQGILLRAFLVLSTPHRADSEEERGQHIGESPVRVTLAFERGAMSEQGEIGQGGETQSGPREPPFLRPERPAPCRGVRQQAARDLGEGEAAPGPEREQHMPINLSHRAEDETTLDGLQVFERVGMAAQNALAEDDQGAGQDVGPFHRDLNG